MFPLAVGTVGDFFRVCIFYVWTHKLLALQGHCESDPAIRDFGMAIGGRRGFIFSPVQKAGMGLGRSFSRQRNAQSKKKHRSQKNYGSQGPPPLGHFSVALGCWKVLPFLLSITCDTISSSSCGADSTLTPFPLAIWVEDGLWLYQGFVQRMDQDAIGCPTGDCGKLGHPSREDKIKTYDKKKI